MQIALEQVTLQFVLCKSNFPTSFRRFSLNQATHTQTERENKRTSRKRRPGLVLARKNDVRRSRADCSTRRASRCPWRRAMASSWPGYVQEKDYYLVQAFCQDSWRDTNEVSGWFWSTSHLAQVGQFGNSFHEVVSFFFVMIFNEFLRHTYSKVIKQTTTRLRFWLCVITWSVSWNGTSLVSLRPSGIIGMWWVRPCWSPW